MKYRLKVWGGFFNWWLPLIVDTEFDDMQAALDEARRWRTKRRWWRYLILLPAGAVAGGSGRKIR
jgi:hypothetical protein